MLNAVLAAIGLLLGVLLFYRKPLLDGRAPQGASPGISVIIPARNEEENLPLLLGDLQRQTLPVLEVLCVDDASQDRTASVALEHGATLIKVGEKPEGWMGKAWACQLGACRAAGSLLLFLDADVRLGPDAVAKLAGTYEKHRCILSVQPYHRVSAAYEQLSFFFNLVIIAANGVGVPFRCRHISLFGPVILFDREGYDRIGGHSAAKDAIADDLALDSRLHGAAVPFRLYLGGDDLSFRMYGGGPGQLLEGWVKNIATGALKTPFILLLMLVCWIGAGISAAVHLVGETVGGNALMAAVYGLLYLLFALHLHWAGRRAGSFGLATALCYPAALLGFFILFLLSAYKRIFHREVRWKGRNIRLRR